MELVGAGCVTGRPNARRANAFGAWLPRSRVNSRLRACLTRLTLNGPQVRFGMTEIERKTRVARSRPTRWSPSMGVLYSHDELNRAADEYLARVAQARERKQAAVKST